MVNEGLCGVNDKVSATGDSNTKLAAGKERLNAFIVKDCHEERADKAAESGANAEGGGYG